jgi:hypothetical protein
MTLRKPRDYQTSEWIAARLSDACGGLKNFAFQLGIKYVSQAQTLTEAGGQQITLDQARRLAIATGSTALAEAVADDIGGRFEPGEGADHDSFEELMARVQVEEGALDAAFIRKLAVAGGIGADPALLEMLDNVDRLIRAARRKLAS